MISFVCFWPSVFCTSSNSQMMENILLDGFIGRGAAGRGKDLYKVSGCHCRQGVAAFNPIAPSQLERRIHTSCHMRGVRSAIK